MHPKPDPDESISERGVPAAASELNNLLQIVAGTVSMLENVWEGAPGSEKYFEMLLVSVERAAKVTAQLVQQVGGADDKILLHPSLAAEMQSHATPRRAPGKGSRCILIVDDEPMALILGQKILSQAGYIVVVAQSGFDALDLFRANPRKFDLVLLDLTMPFMDGEETFKRLRSVDPQVAVLLNTGFIEKHRLERMIANGLSGYLSRPYRAAEVIEQIEIVLQRAGQRGGDLPSHVPTARNLFS
ncbi:MAG: response regulator [Spartobacteria bacterium]